MGGASAGVTGGEDSWAFSAPPLAASPASVLAVAAAAANAAALSAAAAFAAAGSSGGTLRMLMLWETQPPSEAANKATRTVTLILALPANARRACRACPPLVASHRY